MVSEDFKRELKNMFMRGYQEALAQGIEQSRWTIKEEGDPNACLTQEFFVLTISAQRFRVFVLLHFTPDTESEQFVAEFINAGNNAIDQDKFYDCIGEIGNAFCGAMKRDLGKVVPSLGMSTPNKLNSECIKYLTAFETQMEAHASALLDGTAILHASVYL